MANRPESFGSATEFASKHRFGIRVRPASKSTAAEALARRNEPRKIFRIAEVAAEEL